MNFTTGESARNPREIYTVTAIAFFLCECYNIGVLFLPEAKLMMRKMRFCFARGHKEGIILQQQRKNGVFKAFRIIAKISAAASGAFLLLSLMTFMPMIFIKENLSVEAGGLLGFFLDIVKEGENPITSTDLVMSILPRLVHVLLFFIFSLRAASFLKKGEADGSLSFPGSKKAITSLAVISFLIAGLSETLTAVAQKVVSKDFFNITETSYDGWVVLGFVLIFVSLVATEKQKEEQ